MRTPVLVINYKNYRQAYGESGLRIAEEAKRASERYGIEVVVAPPYTEIRSVARVGVPVYAQHADPIGYGASTGSVPIEALRDLGVRGVIINHSEKRVDLRLVARTIEMARRLGLETLVCAEDLSVARMVAVLRPDAIALEPPELIGSGKAVSRERPEVITSGVETVKSIDRDIIVLAGAGITGYEDVVRAVELGSEGVLVASAIMVSEDPSRVINEMARALRESWKRL